MFDCYIKNGEEVLNIIQQMMTGHQKNTSLARNTEAILNGKRGSKFFKPKNDRAAHVHIQNGVTHHQLGHCVIPFAKASSLSIQIPKM